MKHCSVIECETKSWCHGYCMKHYSRWYRTGSPHTVRPKGGGVGPDHSQWKGDDVSYWGVHKRLETAYGKASTHTCTCGNPAEHWAFDEPTGFSTDLTRYTALCASCHKTKDAQKEFTA